MNGIEWDVIIRNVLARILSSDSSNLSRAQSDATPAQPAIQQHCSNHHQQRTRDDFSGFPLALK
jgi:hypothetical protein